MYGIRYLIMLLLVFVSGHFMLAQEFFVFHKLTEGQVRLRVMPDGEEALRFVRANELTFEIIGLGGNVVDPEVVASERFTLQPLSRAAWAADLPTYNDTIGIMARYFADLPPGFGSDFIDPDDLDEGETLDFVLMGMSNISQTQDWRITERMGLGKEWTAHPGVERYGVKIYPTPSGDTLYHEIEIADYTPPGVPEMEAIFPHRKAELSWNYSNYTDTYYGYQIRRSLDGGATFENHYDWALLSGIDETVATVGDTAVLGTTEYFAEDGQRVVYRLYGADYLGGYSEKYSEVRGEIGSELEISPVLIETLQTDSNYAVVRWRFPEEDQFKVREFRILVRPEYGADYETALSGISPEIRQVSIPMKYPTNFYRVQAVSASGKALASFESMIDAIDHEPPAVPTDLTGYIDSTGIAYLSWTVTDEPDLRGYQLYKSLLPDEEFALVNNEPFPGPEYQDSVSMRTMNEIVYYQLRSLDHRGNFSVFTPVLEVKKPDVYPPAAPQILDRKSGRTSIELTLGQSPSHDVAGYRLSRRELNGNNDDYTAVREWTVEEYTKSYLDSLVTSGTAYEYVLQAIDDDGLESKFSQPASLKLRDFGMRPPLGGFAGAQSTQGAKEISLNWQYDQRPRDFYLYRGIGEDPVTLLKVLSGGERSYQDTKLASGQTYRYLLRAIFPDGKVSPFTEEISVTLQ